jgi:RNA polymerase sigma-70 factor (ECF subfamily)
MQEKNGGAAVQKGTSGPNRQENWDVLINRIAHGDQHAMTAFYDETSQIVYSLAVRMVSDRADAEEVAADVYKQVWRSAERYSRERGSAFSWLVSIARSRGIDHLRARNVRSRFSEPLKETEDPRDPSVDPEGQTAAAQQQVRVRAALATLPEDQRRCVELAFFSGLTHSELAAQLGEPLGTVKTRIRSAMLKLRASLGEIA